MSRSSLAPYNPEPVQRLLEQAAERSAEHEPGRHIATLRVHANTVLGAERLLRQIRLSPCRDGPRQGQHRGILSPNCAEFEIAFFGILKAGATVTTVNSGYREREIAYQLQASGAQALIVHHTLADAADLALFGSEEPIERILIAEGADAAPSFWSLIEAQSGPPPEPALDPLEDIAALPFSSGTTGLQKGVMLNSNLHQFVTSEPHYKPNCLAAPSDRTGRPASSARRRWLCATPLSQLTALTCS